MKRTPLRLMALCAVWLLFQTSWAQESYYWTDEGKVILSQDRTAYIVQGDAQAMQHLKAFAESGAVQRSATFERLETFDLKPFAIIHLKEARSLTTEDLKQELGMRSGQLNFVQSGWKLGDGFQLWATARVVSRPKAGISQDVIESLIRPYRAEYTIGMGEVWRIDVPDGRQALALANEMYESGLVEFAQPDFYAPVSKESDPLYPEQFQMNNTGQTIDGFAGAADADCNAPEAWTISTGSSNIVVAVIDDGVENHEDLNDGSGNSRLLGGFTPANNGNGLPNASGAHGQACAGIVAASHNNLGVRGVAPQVGLLSVNIFQGGETTQDIADAITWAKNNGADVLSNSWGYTSCTASFANINNAIADATNNGRGGKGCVIVFASGNGYKSCVDYPANNSNVIAVGAFGNDGIKSDYSNAGSDLDLAAPSNDVSQFGFLTGAGVRTIDRMGGAGYSSGNYTTSFGGTSAACPVVAGVAALVLSVDPNLTHSQVKNTLYTTAIDMGASGFDNNYGHGRVNAFGALNSLGGGGQTPTCTDGIQNGDETGVDCGGSSCPPCQSACSDNAVTLTIVTDNYGNETTWTVTDDGGNTVASGGPYANNTTYTEDLCLTDGCYTFTIFDSYGDGICCSWGNGSYSLVEDATGNTLASGGSFGSSEATPFCLGDTGGGGGGTGGDEIVFAHFFETGWDGWQDGGSDCSRYNGSFSWEGNFSIRLRDNSGVASSMTSSSYDLSSYDAVELEFYFYPNSMENGEDFWVRYNSGSGWQTVATYASGSSFTNGSFYVATVTLDNASVNLSSGARFRFQCDASGNRDQVYIDAVTLTGITAGGTLAQYDQGPVQTIRQLTSPVAPQSASISALEQDLAIAPNPTSGMVTVQSVDPMQRIRVLTATGQQVQFLHNLQDNIRQVDLSALPAGIYFLHIETEEEVFTEKVIRR